MHPKEFLEVTEASLLSHLGEELHRFFADRKPLWTPWDEAQHDAGGLRTLYQQVDGKFEPLPASLQALLYFKREEMNPASAVQPLAQCNIVANATFHLMAQQIAIVLHEMPELNKEKVLQTSFENIRKLVTRYMKAIVEETQDENNDRRDQAGGSGPSGLSP